MDIGSKWEDFCTHINTYQSASLMEEVEKPRRKMT